jgi:hypothetical protein
MMNMLSSSMGTDPGSTVLSMRCQAGRDCTRQAGYVLSGGLSGAARYTCAFHLAEAIDEALGQPVLTPGRQPAVWPAVTVRRA